jgi:hypothetical protein
MKFLRRKLFGKFQKPNQKRTPSVKPSFETLETREVPASDIYFGVNAGLPPYVQKFNAITQHSDRVFLAYEATFTGGVRVAVGDLNNDGEPEVLTAAGKNGGPRVTAVDGENARNFGSNSIVNFFAFETTFLGGVEIAVADVNGDKQNDVIVAAGPGGGPRVRVFDGKYLLENIGNANPPSIMDFFAFESTFTGGVTVTAADFNNDGKAEIVCAAGPGGGPAVKIFNPASMNGNTPNTIPGPYGAFFAYDQSYRGGVNVGIDAVNGDMTTAKDKIP